MAGMQSGEGSVSSPQVRKKPSRSRSSTSAVNAITDFDIDRSRWSSLRLWLDEKLSTQKCETALGVIIITNVVFIILEVDVNAECVDKTVDAVQCHRLWLVVAGNTFLILYTIEAFIKLYVYRHLVLQSRWCMFDVFIVCIGYVDLGLTQAVGATLPAMQMLRIFRVARLLRGIRVLRAIPELHSMVRGFASAMNTMFWGFLMIILLLVLFAIFAVEVINPVTATLFDEDDWCREAFSSVAKSVLYFFQTLVAGDSWGACSIPIVKQLPLTYFIFAGALVCVQLGFTNLVLAVIVEKAAAAHEEDVAKGIREREKQREIAIDMVSEAFESIDMDGSGRLSLAELMVGYDSEKSLREALQMLDVQREDLGDLFHLMDSDDSGDLTYEEVANCIHKSDTQDIRRQIMYVTLHVARIGRKIENAMEMFTNQLSTNEQTTGPAHDSESKANTLESKNNSFSCHSHHLSAMVATAIQAFEHTLERHLRTMDEQCATFAKRFQIRETALPACTPSSPDSDVKLMRGRSESPELHSDIHSIHRIVVGSNPPGVPPATGLRHLVTWDRPQAQWGESTWDESDLSRSEIMNLPLPSKLARNAQHEVMNVPLPWKLVNRVATPTGRVS